MKTVTKVFSLVLAIALLLTVAASAEGFNVPAILQADLDFYTEAELNNVDRVQDQVAAYEAEMDMPELPDIDIYVFDNKYASLEEYARAEAAMFGAVPYAVTLNDVPAWGYISSELYDNEWYIVRNDLFEAEAGKLQETCWYLRTEGYAIADSGITIHLPLLYTEGSATPDLGIDRSFILDTELMNDANAEGNPVEIDFIRKETDEVLGIDDLVISYTTSMDAMTELVTVNGRCWYKIAGWLNAAEGEAPLYSVLYLQEKDDEIIGLQFVFPAESNGADLAIMETTGF